MRVIITALCLFLVSAVQAQDLYKDDVKALLYIKKDFGGGSANQDTSLKLGFTVNHSLLPVNRTAGMNLMSSNTMRMSMIDIEFSAKTRYFSRFNVGGVDALTYRTVLNQNGTTTRWPMGLSTTQMVIGGVVVAVGGYYLVTEVIADGDDNGDVD